MGSSLSNQNVPIPKVGEFVAVNGKTYTTCANCTKVVRVDKPFVGGLHLCASMAGGF